LQLSLALPPPQINLHFFRWLFIFAVSHEYEGGRREAASSSSQDTISLTYKLHKQPAEAAESKLGLL